MGGGRTQEGFWELKGQREVWGTAPGNFLISMLFFFTYIKIFFISFGSLLPPPTSAPLPQLRYCVCIYLYIFRCIYSSIHLSSVHIILIVYLSIYLSFYHSIYFSSVYLHIFILYYQIQNVRLAQGRLSGGGMIPLDFQKGIGRRADESFRAQRALKQRKMR